MIPLSVLVNEGLNLSAIRSPLILTSGTLSITAGEALLVDDAYFFIDNDATDAPAPVDAGL